MTRINTGIRASELPNKALLAEHREIKRIPNAIISGRLKGDSIPSKFCLGKGHVKFFYDKQHYLMLRYKELFYECIHRGFHVQDYSESFERVMRIMPELFGSYVETSEDREILLERLKERGHELI